MKWLLIIIAIVAVCGWWFCNEMDKDMEGY